jgi:hypothetical protein
MALAKHFDRLMDLFRTSPGTELHIFDLRLERCRQREARRTTHLGLFRRSPKRLAVLAR